MKVLPHGTDLPSPRYHSAGAAGFDLHAAVPAAGGLRLDPGGRALIPTGIAIALPEGYEAQARPRSGLAVRDGVTLLNSPGTIDSDYRGEIKLVVINLGGKPFTIERGMRIAQMVVQPVARARLVSVETLPETARGDRGFGSSGSAAE